MADNEEESGPAAEGTSALQGSRRANCATRGQRVNLAASAIPRLVYINNDLDPVSSIAARGEELSISASQRVYPYEGRPFSDEVRKGGDGNRDNFRWQHSHHAYYCCA